MPFAFRPLDEESALTILHWKYEAPYDIYSLASPELEETLRYLLDPQNAFYGMYGQQGELEAFCSFGPDGRVAGGEYSTPALDIGLGLRPDLTGQGHGSRYVNAVIEFALYTYKPDRLRVTIAVFNQRALRVWEKASFRVVQKFKGAWENINFVVLTKDVL